MTTKNLHHSESLRRRAGIQRKWVLAYLALIGAMCLAGPLYMVFA